MVKDMDGYTGCRGCQHYQFDGSCPAFDGGKIPLDILSGDFEHTQKHRLQINSMTWSQRTGQREIEIREQLAEAIKKRNGNPNP
jgi:hypothetical protein